MDHHAVARIVKSIEDNAGSKHMVAVLMGDNNFSFGCSIEDEIQTIISCHEEIASKVEATPK